MSDSPRVLYVAWQDPESRRILPVARVIVDAHGGYEFAYIQAFYEAQRCGFLPLVSFPDKDRVYRSRELLPLLKNRLMQPRRPDYGEYLEELALDPASAEPFTILGRSGGQRVTDKLELFAPPTATADGRLHTIVFVRGVRHVPKAEEVIAQLRRGVRLQAVAELDNAYNPKALKLCHEGDFLGYLPDYLVTELECTPEALDVSVYKMNPPPVGVHHRLLVEVTIPTTKPLPFSGSKYAPLSADATRLAA